MDAERERDREEREKANQRKMQIARLKYVEEKEALQKKSFTSFGKLILADEKASPAFSIGTAHRFTGSVGLSSVPKDTPGPIYSPADETKYKYKSSPKYKIGDSKRPPLSKGEKFDYYNHIDSERDDISQIPKRWKKTIGGAMPLESRVKYDFRESVPGPGRYEPDIKAVRPKSPAYFVGQKTNACSIKLLTGTGEQVAPWTYETEKAKKTSKHKEPPVWTLGKDKRRGLDNKKWTKNETYFLYSSVGNQIITQKKSEPILSIGKSTREKQKKVGMFQSMMSKQPVKIRIEHPKF